MTPTDSTWSVVLVSAFGRGESLALALKEKGFEVRILDFTPAFAERYHEGSGPFPIVKRSYLPQHASILDAVKVQSNGLSFWLPEGPIELAGPMAPFYVEAREDVRAWHGGGRFHAYESIWIKRFLENWTSPYFSEPWRSLGVQTFPGRADIGFIPSRQESRVLSFERFRALGYETIACRGLTDVRFEGREMGQVEAQNDIGQTTAVRAEQWLWFLSGFETQLLSEPTCLRIFPRGVAQPDWVWAEFRGEMKRGPWASGLPEFCVFLGDIHLPWAYSNMACMRRVDDDAFAFWLKVPFQRLREKEARATWCLELQNALLKRLPMAEWKIDPEIWRVDSHALVYDSARQGQAVPAWKNWEWVGPETLPRLDLGALFAREVECMERLSEWRNEKIRKLGKAKGKPEEGDSSDRPLHTS